MRTKKLICTILAIGLLLAGCSGGTDSATPTGPATLTSTSIETSVVTTRVPTTSFETETATETETETETATATETVEKRVVTTVLKTAVRTVSVTAAAEPVEPAAPPATSGSSFEDGTYLIGSEISMGTYKCSDESEENGIGANWTITDSSGETLAIDITAVAYINQGDSVDLGGCDGSWQKVG